MTRNAEIIRHLLLLKDCAIKSHNDTGIININIDSFNFVIDMAIQALEQEPYDDVKYHEEHGEVIVAKEVWTDARKALQALDDIKSEIKFITDTNGVKHMHRDDVFKIIDRHMKGEQE